MKSRFAFTLATRAYLRDHFFEGTAIFPAVEALITLACAVKNQYPQSTIHRMTGAHFLRTLAIGPAGGQQDVHIEIEADASGISASLLTSLKIKNSTMSRNLEHARVSFVQNKVLPEPSMSFRTARTLGGECIHVPAASIYRELIPFGLFYQNIIGDLSVSEEGALADISGGSGDADDTLLGSPFVLDAAMHAACVWGQRFMDIISFPVGFDERIIYAPTKKGGSYLARITPVDVSREPLIFDAWIFDQSGLIYENISGLRMRDMTRGRRKPPQWIKEGAWKKSF